MDGVFKKRTMVREEDVTALLSPGPNAVGVVLADGWFAGRVGWAGLARHMLRSAGLHALFNAELEITYADGTSETIATDSSWKAGDGQIVGRRSATGRDHRQSGSPGWR